MNTHMTLTTTWGLTLAALIAGALQASPALAQRAEPTTMEVCRELVEAARGARSMTQFNEYTRQRSLDSGTMKSCAPELQRDAAYVRLVQQENQTATSLGQQRARQLSGELSRRPEVLEINRSIAEIKQQGSASRRQAESRISTQLMLPEGQRNVGGLVGFQVAQVVPSRLAPGVDIVIEGSYFGHAAGTVVVLHQGQTFAVEIGQWTDGLITGRVDEDISGVALGQGVLRVQKANGLHHDVSMEFIPVYYGMLLADVKFAATADRPKTVTFFDGKALGEHWRLSHLNFVRISPTHPLCTVTLGSPAATWGNPNLTTVAVLGHPPLAGGNEGSGCWAMATVLISGPRGFDPGVEGAILMTVGGYAISYLRDRHRHSWQFISCSSVSAALTAGFHCRRTSS